MHQVVEMGNVSCGDFGCGAVTVEDIPGKGIRCRDDGGQFTTCPPGVMGDVGKFVPKGQDWVGDQFPHHMIVSTPNVRWGAKPGRPRTWHEITRKGLEDFRKQFGRGARIEFTEASPAEARRRGLIAGPWGNGGYVGQGFTREAFQFAPFAIEPHKVIIGNVVGSFVPALVQKSMEMSPTLSPGVKGFVNFMVGGAGVIGIVFFRRNSYVLGASLALLPGFVDAMTTWIVAMFQRRRAAAMPPTPTPTPTPPSGAMGQLLPEQKMKLDEAVRKAFGVTIAGDRGIGQLEARGFETIVPSDYEALAESAVTVAGSAMGQPIGVGPRFKAIGQ